MPKFHTSLVYDEYVNYLKKIKFETDFETDLVSKEQIQNRLKQKFVSSTLHLYGKKFSDFVVINNSVPSDAQFYDLNSIKVNAQSKVELSLIVKVKSLLEFISEWFLFLVCIILNRFTANKIETGSVSLLFGLGQESILNENSDKRFVNYLKSYDKHKIEPLGQFESLVVQSDTRIKSTADHIFYSKYPQAFIFKKYNFKWMQYFKIFGLHFLSLGDFFKIVVCHPELISIARDFSCLRVFSYISGLGLIKDIMYTMSNCTYQPLWMRLAQTKKPKINKVHYSQNCRQLVYKDYLHEAVNPYFFEVFADTAWVWTDDFKQFVSQVYKCSDVRAVGPIMFYLPTEASSAQFNQTEFNISLFDVTPFNDDYIKSIGVLNNYYSSENLKKFLHDLIHVSIQIEKELNLKINIFLKHKRSYHKLHEQSYIDLCSQYISQKKIITIPFEENIFNFIADTDLSVAIPYTSTAHICAHYGKESLYYDPTGEILLQPNFSSKVLLVDDQNKLHKILKQKVRDKFNVVL